MDISGRVFNGPGMRLKQYINEEKSAEEIIQILKKDCWPFLSAMKKCSGSKNFWRGVISDYSDPGFLKKRVRQDRKPKDIGLDLHKTLDKLFLKKFGWKVRSSGVFATSDMGMAIGYGELCLFFPIGKFKFVWSQHIDDLWSYTRRLASLHKERNIDPQKQIVDWYQDNNLCGALYSGNEVTFNCKEYYVVSPRDYKLSYHDIDDFIGDLYR